MLIVSDAKAVGIAVLVHDGAGLTAAGLAEYVGYFQLAPAVLELSIPIHRTDTLYLFEITIRGCNGIHDLLIARAGLDKFNDFVGITALTLTFIGQFAAFFKRVGEVDAFMQMAAGILVGVRAVRLLVELVTVLEDVGAIFGGLATGNIAVERGETSIHL